MKWLFRFIGSLVAALVATVGAAVVTAIWLMFSAGSEGRRLGYFGAVFVDVTQTSQGTTQLGVGLADPLPLVLSVVAVTLFLLAVLLVHDQLRARRKQLLADAE
jgi:hypothetical protein